MPDEPQRTPPAPPATLAAKATTVWVDLNAVYDFRPDELRLLEDACRTIDLVEKMERRIRRDGLVVKGSTGQNVAHPLVTEIRQHRSVLARLFKQLDLPEGGEVPVGASVGDRRPAAQQRSTKARAAAEARWKGGQRGA